MSLKTKAATAYTEWRKAQPSAAVTWADLSIAYDEGIRMGLSAPKEALRQLREADQDVHEKMRKRIERA